VLWRLQLSHYEDEMRDALDRWADWIEALANANANDAIVARLAEKARLQDDVVKIKDAFPCLTYCEQRLLSTQPTLRRDCRKQWCALLKSE
jgi:hypothetical protein